MDVNTNSILMSVVEQQNPCSQGKIRVQEEWQRHSDILLTADYFCFYTNVRHDLPVFKWVLLFLRGEAFSY